MTGKVFNLISALIWGAQVVSIAIVTFFNPALAVTINSSIVIVNAVAIEVCSQFVKD